MQRNPNESFSAYKKRRADENYRIKKFLKGFLFYQDSGPYVRPVRKQY